MLPGWACQRMRQLLAGQEFEALESSPNPRRKKLLEVLINAGFVELGDLFRKALAEPEERLDTSSSPD